MLLLFFLDLTDPIDVFCEWIDSAAEAQLDKDEDEEVA